MLVTLVILIGISTCFAVDPADFQANLATSSNIAFLLPAANQVISANVSQDVAATYALGVGDPSLTSIYSNWPVTCHYVHPG
jgi:hypothetical protein